MAVDIEGFDIVFSSANANHAREIDQSIARMSEKVPTLSMGLSEMAKALDALGKINVDGVKKNLDAVKNSIENIDGSKLNKVFELATVQSEGLLNSVTSLVNMLGKVDLSSLRGGAKTEIYDERSRVTTTRETGVESQNQEQINALIAQREQKLQSLRSIEEGLVSAEANEVENAQKKLQLEQRELQIIEQQNGKKQEAITADKSTLTAIQGVVKEYDKAEKELEKMANKLGTAFQGAPQELQDYVFRTRQMLHNLVSDINASFSNPSQIQLWKGLHFPNEQIRAEFETLLKDLKGEAEAYFMNLWSNVQTNVGRGKGYTAKSVEPIGDNWDMDSRSYLSNAEEKLERMYLLLQHIRDYGNQPFFEGLQKDITNIAALDERIAVLDAQIEAVQKYVFSMPVSGEYGDVLTHRMQQLQNVRELLDHIRDAQSRDMVDGDLFTMNEQALKERLEKQKQAVIEAEREAQKQVGTDWEEEAKRELENRKKILADTQLAVSSLGLLGEQNEIKNAERQAASYKEMQERLAQNTKDEIAQLDREIAEEKQKLEVEKQQTNELEKQKALKQSDAKGTLSSGEVVISVKFDEKTVLSEIKNISERLATLFKDIPVSLRKELDLTFFAEKANELKKMFDGITVTGIQPTSVKKTENTVSTPKLDAGSSRLSTDSALVIEAAFERMNNLTNALIEKIRSIGNAENTMFADMRADIQSVTTALQGIVEKLTKVKEKSTQNNADLSNVGLSASQIKSMENEYARILVQIDKVKAAIRSFESEAKFVLRAGDTETISKIYSANSAADKELERLTKRKEQLENESQLQLDKIREKYELKRGEQAVKDFERAEREKTRIADREAKKRADEEKKKIQGYKQQNLEQNTSLVGAAEFAKTANTINRLQTALKYLQDALSKTKPNTPEWNNANKVYQETKKRLDDIKKSMESVKTQANSIIPSLQNLAMQIGLVFSVQQLNQWVKHMVEVRSEFELQNIALRSIIQNKEKADQIFAEVQQLALKSPFSIMELNKFTKQMAAYGVEADKLVGTTKQLADVSAGLGVDMGRLILAYGQVKTANYLRATEVRQFTEAGLNITQELANYFTELNGKMVTAGEVTEMITKRMVKFEDVAEVFKRVTSAGGMFYEMQEKQSEGLKGQIQRIGDAYSIMLNDIGKSNQGTIAGVLATVRELIKNWRVVAEYIKMAAGAYLLYEAYVHRGIIIKVVKSLANAWQLVTKAINGSTAATFMQTGALGKLGMIANVVTTVVRGIGVAMKAALNATIIGAIVYGLNLLVNYFVEAKAKADQLKESLGNIDKEVGKEFDNSAAAYERLSRAIIDSSNTFDERNEAMSELKRTFKDILPDEYLQLSYIEQHAGNWNEAEKAMKQYYDSLALEKEKAAIKDANMSEIKDAKEDIAGKTIDKLGKGFGISENKLQSFVDNILQQMLDGSITTTKDAVDEYIRQIEAWNSKKLTESQKETVERAISSRANLYSKDMKDLLDIAKEMAEEFDNLADRQNHYASASEKAQAEAEALIKTRATGVKELIERTKSGLDQINSIQRQIAQVDMQVQDEETINQKAFLQERLNEAIKQEKDLYEAIGIEIPKSFEKVSSTTINIRNEIARVSSEIAKIFVDGVNPAVVTLHESYQKLSSVQKKLNDGTKRSQEEVERLKDAENRRIGEIKSQYRQMGVEMQGDIEKVASSQDLIRTEMIRVCDSTREYFKKGLIDKMTGWIGTLGTTIEEFLSGLGIEVHLVDRDNIGYDIQPSLDANEKLLKSKLNVNDEIINSDNRLVLEQGQTVKDYVKNLKTLKEEDEKVISQYNKAKDKKEWLSLNNLTEANIKELKERSKAAKEIAEAYDPTLFDKKGGRTRNDNTEEIARKRFEFINRANTEYEKLLKNYDAETAKAKILSDMMGEARALGVEKQFAEDLFTKASTLDTLKNVYDTFYRGIVAKYPKIAMEFQKTFNGIALDIDVKLRDEDRDEIRKQMDELMGGYELAIELEKSGVDSDILSQLFGIDTFDLSDVSEGIENVWIDALNKRAERAAKATGDEFKAYKSLEEAKAKMGEEDVKLFESQQNKISDTFAKELRAREKEYAKYLKKSYSDSVNEQVNAYRQLMQLQFDAGFKRETISKNTNLDEKAKADAIKQIDAQTAQIAAKMQEELQEKLNKIQWESFKDSPLFETVLSDIENLGNRTIDTLLVKLEELKSTFKDIDPKSIKEITKYINQLTAQRIKNNPFKAWSDSLREINSLKKQGNTLDKLNEYLISDSNELTRLNAKIESYNKVLAIKQQMTHVTEQDIKLMQTDTQTLERQLRVLEEQKHNKSGAGVGVDGSDESKAMDLQIKKIQEILAARRTILASNGDNVVLSSKEIALLQQESDEITKQVLLLSKKKGLKEEDIEKIKSQIDSWDELSEAQQGAISILNKVGEAASSGFSVAEAAMNAFGGSSDEVTKSMLQGFDDCLQACLSLTTSIIAMGTAANAASGIIGIIASALTAVAAVFKTIFNVHESKLEKSIKEHQRQVKKLEAEYDNLSDAISNAFSGFQLGTNTQAAIQNLERQNEQYRAMIENEKDKKDTDEDQIADWEQTIADNLEKAQELRQQYFTELGGLGSGSDVRDAAGSFVDAWVEAFGETRDGISGLKDEFDDFMKSIVKKQAYMKIADHWIKKFGDMINDSFDKYGQVNYEKLQSAMKWFTEEAIPQMDNALEDMTDFWENIGINWTGTTSSLSGLAEGIQGITEETAQILEALLNSMRYYVADTNEQLRQIFNTMTNPNEENPFLKELKNQTKYLASIDKRLDSVISATKRASGSHINVFTT